MSEPITGWGLAALILLPMAQLYARIFWMNGSLDHWWLLIPIFWFPPFSLVPALMIYFGKVKNGQGKTAPYDWWMLLPVIIKFCIGILVSYLVSEPSFFSAFIPLMIQIGVNAIPHYYRAVNNCGPSFSHIGKAFIDGIIENGVGDIAPTILKFVPFVGIAFRLLDRIPIIGPFVDKIIWSIMYLGTYIIINMINEGIDIQKFCNIGFFGKITDIIAAVIFLISSLALCSYNGALDTIGNIQGYAMDYAYNYGNNYGNNYDNYDYSYENNYNY